MGVVAGSGLAQYQSGEPIKPDKQDQVSLADQYHVRGNSGRKLGGPVRTGKDGTIAAE